MLVPPTTKIRPARVGFIDTDRLLARLAWLTVNKARLAREADGRVVLRTTALEIHTIHRELCSRGVHHV